MEERLQCQGSGKVRYASKDDTQLHLAIPLAAATNSAEVAQYQVGQPLAPSLSRVILPVCLCACVCFVSNRLAPSLGLSCLSASLLCLFCFVTGPSLFLLFCLLAPQKERKQKRQKLTEEAGKNGCDGAPQPAAPPATGKEEEEPEVVPVVPFEACLAGFATPEVIDGYASPALPPDAPRTTAVKAQRFKTFPPYLVVHLQRYYVDVATWQGKKMEVSVPMPLQLDLTALRCVALRVACVPGLGE